jgi:periplasmic protein CpxP/Spy
MNIKFSSFLSGAIALMIVASPIIPVFTNPAVAQSTNEGRGGKKFAQLNLTDEQKAKIKQIREATKQQIDAILTSEQKEQRRIAREQNKKPRLNLTDDQKAKIKAIRQDSKAQIEAVLTPEQKQKLEELRQQWRQNNPSRRQRSQSN